MYVTVCRVPYAQRVAGALFLCEEVCEPTCVRFHLIGDDLYAYVLVPVQLARDGRRLLDFSFNELVRAVASYAPGIAAVASPEGLDRQRGNKVERAVKEILMRLEERR